ncbi:amidohydrolase family protein [Marinobacter sp. F4206]|uniref:amidohydrolase family protein n=1 Tax=Marinobacter sp. F4206 TaxID=2861777 RepID=UPI001C5F182A|nr:amidohydrolase family protein [Marinobacter sp. F4206]MBW4934466.1 D-glutamate deacylase [Marinobacter sp. F4206]
MNHSKIFVAAFFLGGSIPSFAQDYDLVINNGRVMDPESMLDAVLNVGVKDGRIARITPEAIKGSEAIDATGHVVAPGFIDLHFHALDGLSLKLAALDGVTTGMDLEAGAIHVAEWYAEKDESGWPLNYGTGVSQEMTRTRVHDPEVDTSGWHDATSVFALRAQAVEKDGVPGWSVTRSNLDQLNKILGYMDEELRQGALSIASTVGYMSEGVTTFEMFKTQEVAANYGRLLGAHVRFHGNPSNPEGPLGTSELLANAMALDAPFSLNHNNEYGWWENEEKLQKARAQGYNVWSEYYPYSAASTAISAEFFSPEKFAVLAGGRSYEETIYDPVQDKFLTQEEWEKTSKAHPDRTIFAFNPKRDDWLPYWMRMPHMIVASDAMWSGKGIDSWDLPPKEYVGHPRTAGTRGKTLRAARENGVPLMFTIAQMAYWPAYHLGLTGLEGMQERGRLQEGMIADITIFDPHSVTDNATYKAGEQGLPTTGIPYVIVSGVAVVRDSQFQLNVRPGKSIRFPVEERGKFEPITVEGWTRQLTIPTFSVDGGGLSPRNAADDGSK